MQNVYQIVTSNAVEWRGRGGDGAEARAPAPRDRPRYRGRRPRQRSAEPQPWVKVPVERLDSAGQAIDEEGDRLLDGSRGGGC